MHRDIVPFVTELRIAFRALLRQPVLSLVAFLTLVLGIGANTAIFSLVKTVVLDPLPYVASHELVVLWERKPEGGTEPVAPLTYFDWKERAQSFASMGAYRHVRYGFASDEEPLDVPSVSATPELFSLLGARTVAGRAFIEEEGVPGNDKVVLLSEGLWRRHFGSDRSIVGKTVELDAVSYTIVGVLAHEHAFPPGAEVHLWTPLVFDPNDGHGRSRRARFLNVLARLRDGGSIERAREEMTSLSASIAEENPDTNAGWSVALESAHEQLVSTARPALLLLLAAVGFLLLIVCVNVANLMLARLTTRKREIALRAALGASRWALVRQVLAESLLLASAGGLAGLVLAYAGVRFARQLPLANVPRLDAVEVDVGVLAYTGGVSVLVAIMFGLLPALSASRPELRDSLNEGGRSAGSNARTKLGLLVAAEVALALVLLVSAGLTLRSFRQMMAVDPGFQSERLLAAQIYLPRAKYPSSEARLRFFSSLLERLRAAPGVESAAAVNSLPMHPVGIDFALPFTIEGRPESSEEPRADVRAAMDGYFETMRIPLLRGRVLDERDREDSPRTVLINETFVRRHFVYEDPIGRVIDNAHGKAEVVGVVADVHHYGLDAEPRPELYLAFRQNVFSGMSFVVRTSSAPESFAATLREAVWEIDSDQAIFDVSTMQQAISRWVFLPKLSSELLLAFAGVALLLAGVGIYGVIAYSVSQRTAEMGLRMALGAGSRDLVKLVVENSMRFVLVGMVLGLVSAMFLARFLSGQLFGVSPLDPAVYLGVSALLGATGLLASYMPARRATRVDPIDALRVE
jgi:putative ABC transport system permease protein